MAYRNNTLPGAYNDLEYANYTPVVPMRPVKELTDLYAAKQQDYIYAKDAASRLGTAIVNTPHTADDEGAIRQVNQEVNSVLSQWEEQGDYENRKLDVDKLVQDVTKKLMPLQQKKAQESAWLEQALARDKEGNYIHNPNDVKKAMVINSKINKPSVYDPELGTYIGNFSGVDVPINKNYSEEVAKVLKGWEANEITLTDRNGNPLVRLPNTGYYQAGSKTYTDDAELVNAAKSYLMVDPDFNHKLQFDLMYDLATLTDSNGNPRGVNMSDISRLPKGVVAKVAKEYELIDGKPLQEQLKEKQIPLEEFYSNVKIEDITNKTIELGVSQQSFEAYKSTYLKDILAEESRAAKRSKEATVDDSYTSISKVFTDNVVNPKDYNSIKEGYDVSQQSLQDKKGKLNKALQSGTATPEDIEDLKNQVQRDAENLENFERQLKSLRTHVETQSNFNFDASYQEYINSINSNRKKYDAAQLSSHEVMANRYNPNPKEYGTSSKAIEKYPMLPFDEYKTSVIESFINKDYVSVLEDNRLNPDKGRIDYTAKKLREAYGGDVEVKPYNMDYHTINVEGEGKKATLYRGFLKSKKADLVRNPETFLNGEDNLLTLMDKQKIKGANLEKSEILFLRESYNKKPGYLVILNDDDGKQLGKVVVNHEGSLLDDRNIVSTIMADEAYNRFKDSDIPNLDVTEKAVFKTFGSSYFDNSPISKNFDDLNLYATNEGDESPLYLDGVKDGSPDMVIVTRKNFSNPDQSKYLVKFSNGMFLCENPDGSNTPVLGYEGQDKPMTFNSPSEIKEELGSGLLLNDINRRLEEEE